MNVRAPATASHPERLIFDNTFEGLYRYTSAQLPEGAVARLRQASGVDFTRPLLPAYPAEVFVALVRAMATELHGALPEDERLRRIGRAVLEGYRLTLIGRAVEKAARLFGPVQVLQRVSGKFRTSDTFTAVQVEPRGEGDLTLHVNDLLGMPTYYQGFFEVILEGLGVRNPSVAVEGLAAPGGKLRVRWDAPG